jgi:hypothetical protein
MIDARYLDNTGKAKPSPKGKSKGKGKGKRKAKGEGKSTGGKPRPPGGTSTIPRWEHKAAVDGGTAANTIITSQGDEAGRADKQASGSVASEGSGIGITSGIRGQSGLDALNAADPNLFSPVLDPNDPDPSKVFPGHDDGELSLGDLSSTDSLLDMMTTSSKARWVTRFVSS